MAPIDIIVLALIGIAFVAVCVRAHRKGICADCAQGGSCGGSCGGHGGKKCAAAKGIDQIYDDLSRGVK